MTLNELRDEIHATAREKGWYNDGERNIRYSCRTWSDSHDSQRRDEVHRRR